MKSRATERGQITIPKELRERLGIRPGQEVEFREEEGGRIVLARRPGSDPVEQVYGILRLQRSTAELMDDLRGAGAP
jgi:AbrB family looped-hinge helix DNA binding protein